MTEILMTPQAGTAPPRAASRGAEPRTNEVPKTDTETGAQVPFAAVLKSRSEKQPAESSKDSPSAAEAPEAIDGTVDTSASTLPALITIPVTERPRAANIEYASFASATGSPGLDQLNALASAAPASSPMQGTSPTVTQDAFDTLRHSAEARANPTGAVTPTPTFPLAGIPNTDHNFSVQQVELGAGLAIEKNPAPDKLAVEAANAATTAKVGNSSTGFDLNEPGIRAVIDQTPSSPAVIGNQPNGTSAPMAATSGMRVETPLGQPGWRDEVGQKLTWMASNGRQQAELTLNPPQLGRIEVTLTLDDDRASVSFATPHAVVRETLENSMWRLREMFSDAGVTLGQTHVGADSGTFRNPMPQNNDRQASTRSAGAGLATTASLPGGETAWITTSGRGMVDVFA